MMRDHPARGRRIVAVLAAACVLCGALLVHVWLVRAGDHEYGDVMTADPAAHPPDRAQVPAGVVLARVRSTAQIDLRLATIGIKGDEVSVNGRRVALSDGDALPALHAVLESGTRLSTEEGSDPRGANLAVDARTPFSEVAAVIAAAKGSLAHVTLVATDANGRVGVLPEQPVSTPPPLCILGAVSDGGGFVVERAWYDIEERVRPYREADEAANAIRPTLRSDAAALAHSLDDLLDGASGAPCAYVCRDHCAPVLAPGPDTPFGDVAVALDAARAVWPAVVLAWQRPR
jgi:hypothetical protein